MKIADLDFYLLDPSGGLGDSTERTLLVRLATPKGQEGWGEARTSWRPSELGPRRDTLLPILAGHYVANVEELLSTPAVAPPPLRAAVEMACWDLIARAARQPLYGIWGGEYRPRVPLAIRLPPADPDTAAQLARDFFERGFHTQIVVAAGDSENDLAVVQAVRQATADRVKLRLDGGSRFSADAARELCRGLERAGVQFFLDPLESGLDGFAALSRQTTVPLALSASIHGPGDVLALARGGATTQLVIDVAAVGGLWRARECAMVAAAARLPASLRGAAGLGVSLAGVLQLAAATPHLEFAHECAAYQLHKDVLRERPAIVDGASAIPQLPGLGIEVDRARLEAFQVT